MCPSINTYKLKKKKKKQNLVLPWPEQDFCLQRETLKLNVKILILFFFTVETYYANFQIHYCISDYY